MSTKGEIIMAKQLDLRVQRTYKLLTDALIELLKSKSFDDITVKALCEEAMVRRATFYKHFADKQELLAFIIRNIEDEFKATHVSVHDQHDPQLFYVAMIDKLLSFAEEQWDLLKIVFGNKSANQLEEVFIEEIERDIRMELINDQKKGNKLLSKPEVVSTMMAGAIHFLLKRWLLGEIEVTREELIECCIKIRFIEK